MRQLKDLGLIIAYELHGFRLYKVSNISLPHPLSCIFDI